MNTKVIFIRHGEARGNVERRFHGHFDSALTDNGRRQIMLLAKRLENEPIDVIYSSDLQRAIDTAREVAKLKHLDINIDPNLREIFGGDWEDVPWDDLPVNFSESYEHWLTEPHLLKMPGGESMLEFQMRVKMAVRGIIEKNRGENILIATHGTVIKVLVCGYLGMELSEMPSMKWYDNASVTIVDVDDEGKYNVVLEGDNSHLGEYSTLEKQTWWRE